MLNCRNLLIAAFLPLGASASIAAEPGDPDPLFDDDSPADFTVTAAMMTLLGGRLHDSYLQNRLSYPETGGESFESDAGIRTHGNFRRNARVCPFPPLRINLLNCRNLLIAALLTLGTSTAIAAEPGKPDPLFADNAAMEITITAPMKTLLGERPNDTYLRGTLSYRETDGRVVEFDVGIRTRGNFRRDARVCPFPPLRINFKKSEVKDTLFHHQDKLKLVAHCRDKSDRYEQNVIEEYLTYRILNTLTDISYRVRLAQITYVDSEQKYDDRVRYGFFIEHKKRVSQRLDLPLMSTPGIQASDLAGPYSDLTSLFQFMIGNTDFSPIAGPEGEDCCHNSTLFGGESGPVYSIPYDFDMSGLVNAPYAEPNPQFRIRRVTQRLYRGRCDYIGNLETSVKLFQDKREAIYGLFEDQQELEQSTRKKALKYIDRFYDVVEDPRKRQREIESQCL